MQENGAVDRRSEQDADHGVTGFADRGCESFAPLRPLLIPPGFRARQKAGLEQGICECAYLKEQTIYGAGTGAEPDHWLMLGG